MRKAFILLFVLTAAVIASFALLSSCTKRAAQCPLCDREIHKGMQVKVTHNRIPMHTCCMACALTYKAQNVNVEIKSVTDFRSGKSIDPREAFYVVDSDISPCLQDPKVQKYIREPHSNLHACYDRCAPGILAFSSRTEAAAFIQQHGGVVGKFDRIHDFISVKGGHHD